MFLGAAESWRVGRAWGGSARSFQPAAVIDGVRAVAQDTHQSMCIGTSMEELPGRKCWAAGPTGRESAGCRVPAAVCPGARKELRREPILLRLSHLSWSSLSLPGLASF